MPFSAARSRCGQLDRKIDDRFFRKMASPLRRSLSRGAASGALSLGSAVTPRSAQGAALIRAASNASLHSMSSVGARTPKTPRTPRTPKTPNSSFFSPSISAAAGYAANFAHASPEDLPSPTSGSGVSPERHRGLGGIRHQADLPILLGQSGAQTSPSLEEPRSVRFQDDLDSFARSTREMVMMRQRARRERKEMVDKAMRENMS
ncbi:unnamed protein product [Effrenium voratum]|nr:unnamed protein product [Effrenium voratum]